MLDPKTLADLREARRSLQQFDTSLFREAIGAQAEATQVLTDIGKRTFELSADFREALSGLNKRLSFVSDTFRSGIGSAIALAERYERQRTRSAKLQAAGLLPHRTMPWALIDEVADTSILEGVVLRDCDERWTEISEDLRRSVEGYDIDDEAKNTFREALICHQQGLYRATVRLLFPEVERLIRVEFYENGLEGISSIKDIRESAGNLPAGEILSFYTGVELFHRLQDHLYVNINDRETQSRFEADAVPNRHAAIHGIVVYRTKSNSLNMLILADFLFHVVARIKKYAVQDARDEIAM